MYPLMDSICLDCRTSNGRGTGNCFKHCDTCAEGALCYNHCLQCSLRRSGCDKHDECQRCTAHPVGEGECRPCSDENPCLRHKRGYRIFIPNLKKCTIGYGG